MSGDMVRVAFHTCSPCWFHKQGTCVGHQPLDATNFATTKLSNVKKGRTNGIKPLQTNIQSALDGAICASDGFEVLRLNDTKVKLQTDPTG